jgi:hypothetical protein
VEIAAALKETPPQAPLKGGLKSAESTALTFPINGKGKQGKDFCRVVLLALIETTDEVTAVIKHFACCHGDHVHCRSVAVIESQ